MSSIMENAKEKMRILKKERDHATIMRAITNIFKFQS